LFLSILPRWFFFEKLEYAQRFWFFFKMVDTAHNWRWDSKWSIVASCRRFLIESEDLIADCHREIKIGVFSDLEMI